jgi:D-alanine-D-alanine ligase
VAVTAVSEQYAAVTSRLRNAADHALAMAPGVRLLFVTNIRPGEMTDFGPKGLSNAAQHYTRWEADEMIRLLQDLGFTVESFFSEMEFLSALVRDERSADPRPKIVYTTAEGGSGSGRRALIPALCNLQSLPVLNSGAHASSIARHKLHAYAVLRLAGVRAPRTWQYADGRWAAGLKPSIGSRVIVKPTYESMGIGIDETSTRVIDPGFESFLAKKCSSFGQPAIVQEFVSGEEVGVPVARIESTYALPPIAQRHANGEPYYSVPKTFEDENLRRDLSHARFEAEPAQLEALRQAAIHAFDALGMEGVGRIDFKIDADGRAWAFDTNESPPPRSPTCWAMAMEELGFSLREMVAAWVGICLLNFDVAQESDQKESSTQGISRP